MWECSGLKRVSAFTWFKLSVESLRRRNWSGDLPGLQSRRPVSSRGGWWVRLPHASAIVRWRFAPRVALDATRFQPECPAMMQQANTVEKICRRAATLVALCVFPLWAAQTARLTGRVVDEDSVQVNSAQVILVQEGRTVGGTFTDDSGHFEFDALAPGVAMISVRKPGYFELTVRAATLNAGENDLTLTLTHETELNETVEVRSSAAQLDPMQTAHQDGLVQRDILDTPVPNSHDLKQSLAAIPQVVTDNTSEIHFAGARAGET